MPRNLTSFLVEGLTHRRVLFSIRRAAKIIGVSHVAIRHRIRHNTIEHCLLNCVATIPDYAAYAETTKDRKIRMFCVKVPYLIYKTTMSKDWIPFASLVIAEEFLENYPGGEWRWEEREVPKWNRGKPDEYFESSDFTAYAQQNRIPEGFEGVLLEWWMRAIDCCGVAGIHPEVFERVRALFLEKKYQEGVDIVIREATWIKYQEVVFPVLET